jgi:hypothetical protein
MPLPLLSLIPLLAGVAPTLVALLTGSDRAGRIAESAAAIVGEVTGVPVRSAADAAEAAEALADPTTRAELQRRLAELEAAEVAQLLEDRADARARDVAVRRLNGGENRQTEQLVWVIVVLLVATLGANVAIGVWAQEGGPHLTAAVGLLGTAAGFLLRGLSSVLDFHFGSSVGSRGKDDAIASLAAARPEPPATPIAGPLRSLR